MFLSGPRVNYILLCQGCIALTLSGLNYILPARTVLYLNCQDCTVFELPGLYWIWIDILELNGFWADTSDLFGYVRTDNCLLYSMYCKICQCPFFQNWIHDLPNSTCQDWRFCFICQDSMLREQHIFWICQDWTVPNSVWALYFRVFSPIKRSSAAYGQWTMTLVNAPLGWVFLVAAELSPLWKMKNVHTIQLR